MDALIREFSSCMAVWVLSRRLGTVKKKTLGLLGRCNIQGSDLLTHQSSINIFKFSNWEPAKRSGISFNVSRLIGNL